MNMLLKLLGFSCVGRIAKQRVDQWAGWGMGPLPRGAGSQNRKKLPCLLPTLKTTTGVEALRPTEL